MSEQPTRRTFVSIEIEMGVDDEWQQMGLEEPPDDAASLLAQIKSESHNNIATFIRDWSLDDFVTVTIGVTHNDLGGVTRSSARWSEPAGSGEAGR